MSRILIMIICIGFIGGCENRPKQSVETVQEKTVADQESIMMKTEPPKNKKDAEEALNRRFGNLEERVSKLAQRPPRPTQAEQDEFGRMTALVNSNLIEAAEKVKGFAHVSQDIWQESYRAANNELDKLEKGIAMIE